MKQCILEMGNDVLTTSGTNFALSVSPDNITSLDVLLFLLKNRQQGASHGTLRHYINDIRR